jgi:hypothetical protein
MQNVSRFEANLLHLLYYFLRREPPERALPLVENRCDVPACLSPGAVRLVRDALGKGCTQLLASRGGWRKERFLRGDQVRTGRLWERTQPQQLGLTFSPRTMEFLLAITAQRPSDEAWAWHPAEDDLTDGDRLLLFFAHEGLRETSEYLGATMRRLPPLGCHGLCWLAYPEDYGVIPEGTLPTFGAWTTGTGACILEALQPDLARRWETVEGSKEGISDPRQMRALGQSQQCVLSAFLDALDRAGRWDLARFLLQALANILGPHAHAGMWTARLHVTGLRLADRAAVYQGALAPLRHADRLRDWARRARTVGYFDEGYAAAQLWKADWERFDGDALCERAHTIAQQLDPMRQANPSGH